MQVDSMQNDIRVCESLFERGSGRDSHNHLAVDRVEHRDGLRDDRFFEYGLTDAKTLKHMKDVGAKLDAVTDRTKFRCFFENFNRPSLAPNPKCNGKAADTAADNENGRAVGHLKYRLADTVLS